MRIILSFIHQNSLSYQLCLRMRLNGDTTNDIVIAPDCRSVQLRAERAGTSDGRVYAITLRLSDNRGNVTRRDFEVSVPIDQEGVPAVKGAPALTVIGGCQQ
jgi:hypothetical protein